MSANNELEPKQTSEKLSLGNSGQIAINGILGILNLLASCSPAHAIGSSFLNGAVSVGIFAQHAEQQRKFESSCKKKFDDIDKTKVDNSYLDSPEFREFLIKIIYEAGSAASEQKLNALAKCLVNSTIYPTSRISEKLMIIRSISYMSDEALRVLMEMQNAWEDNVPILGIDSLQEALGDLEPKKIHLACESLIQLRILESIGAGKWSLGLLGRDLASLLSGKEEREDFEDLLRKSTQELKVDLESQIRSLRNKPDTYTEILKNSLSTL